MFCCSPFLIGFSRQFIPPAAFLSAARGPEALCSPISGQGPCTAVLLLPVDPLAAAGGGRQLGHAAVHRCEGGGGVWEVARRAHGAGGCSGLPGQGQPAGASGVPWRQVGGWVSAEERCGWESGGALWWRRVGEGPSLCSLGWQRWVAAWLSLAPGAAPGCASERRICRRPLPPRPPACPPPACLPAARLQPAGRAVLCAGLAGGGGPVPPGPPAAPPDPGIAIPLPKVRHASPAAAAPAPADPSSCRRPVPRKMCRLPCRRRRLCPPTVPWHAPRPADQPPIPTHACNYQCVQVPCHPGAPHPVGPRDQRAVQLRVRLTHQPTDSDPRQPLSCPCPTCLCWAFLSPAAAPTAPALQPILMQALHAGACGHAASAGRAARALVYLPAHQPAAVPGAPAHRPAAAAGMSQPLAAAGCACACCLVGACSALRASMHTGRHGSGKMAKKLSSSLLPAWRHVAGPLQVAAAGPGAGPGCQPGMPRVHPAPHSRRSRRLLRRRRLRCGGRHASGGAQCGRPAAAAVRNGKPRPPPLPAAAPSPARPAAGQLSSAQACMQLD